MSRITDAFKNGKVFIPYIVCGDPDLETTAKIVRSMSENGADIIELGIPFSDPTAEGPVIQEGSLRALTAGARTDSIMAMVKELRRDISTPMVFMTYANVVFSYGAAAQKNVKNGTERFLSECRDVGIDGLILPDVPFEEREEFLIPCEKYGIDLISLITPASAERIGMIAREARGFVYVVSSHGVTGVRERITSDISSMVEEIRKNTKIPCAVGFGISTPEQAAAMAADKPGKPGSGADGVIVGSAIVKIIGRSGRDSAGPVGEYVRSMKNAVCGKN